MCDHRPLWVGVDFHGEGGGLGVCAWRDVSAVGVEGAVGGVDVVGAGEDAREAHRMGHGEVSGAVLTRHF